MYKGLLILFLSINIAYVSATTSELKKASSYTNHITWAFEENKGQVTGADSAKVTYFYKQGAKTMYLLHSGLAYQFEKRHYPEGYKSPDKYATREELDSFQALSKKIRMETYRMDIELIGANRNPEIIAEGKSPDYIQYYNHNALDVHAYQKIIYKNVYPNIDWVIYSTNNEQLATNNLSSNTQNSNLIKYDFIVHPGGNPADIRLQTHWVEDLAVNSDGSLSMKNRMGSVIENRPISYQGSRELSSQFKLENNIISFDIKDYNASQDLIIDPSIAWATYYGGSDEDKFYDCSTDKLNNVYVTGKTSNNTNIASGGYQNTYGGNYLDAMLVKFNNDGKRIWATYYGGSGYEYSLSCATDAQNNIFMVGITSSNGLAYNGYQNTMMGANSACYFVKFNSDGFRQWASYLNAYILECAIDNADNLYLAGDCGTIIASTITTGAHQTTFGGGNGGDGYLAKFSSSGSILWATFYGGSRTDRVNSVSTDISGNVFISGLTSSKNNISYNGFQDTLTECICVANTRDTVDAFLVKFNSAGVRQWGTYFGGENDEDFPSSCATDKIGNVYFSTRIASNLNFSFNGHQSYKTSYAYVPLFVKFNSAGVRQWATYYGDTLYTLFGNVICKVDEENNPILVGDLYEPIDSNHNIASGGFQNLARGRYDFFIVKFQPNGTRIWGSFFGGKADEIPLGISISQNNDIFICGITDTLNNNLIPNNPSLDLGYKGHKMTYSGKSDGILIKICDKTDTAKITISSDKNITICPSTQVKFTAKDMFGGNTPHYIWRKNSVLVGTDTNVYSIATLSNNDTIQCTLISSATCIDKDTAWSNKIVMKVKLADTTNKYDTICGNKYYVFNNQLITTAGFYRDTLISSIGCDSFIFLHLYVKPFSSYSYNFTTSCTSPSYYFNNQTLTQSGIYKDTLTNIYGCDSFITLNLKVVKPSSTSLSITRCPNQPYFFNGQNRTTSGTYTQILTNTQGCDSTITLNLNVLTNPASQSNTIWACTPFVFQGKTYMNNAVVKDTLKSSYGCDSLYLTHNLFLKPIPATRSVIEHIVCDSVWIGGIKYANSFSYIDTFRTTADISCDSLYQPVQYTIKYTPNLTISAKQIDTFYKGETVNLYPSQALNYLWQTGEKTRAKSFVINSDQTIYLIGWNDTECRDTAFIQLIALDPTILDFPTGFSPTGIYADNHYFKPNINGRVEKIRFDIYNRLGEKVYFSTQPNMIGWDGTYRGKDCPAGLYSYICEYTTNRRIYFKTGEVMLVR